MTPLVLLDVDGVLNALGPAGEGWPDWRTGTAPALGRSWPVRWSPSVVDRVLSWRQVADVQWLTTWGYDANSGLNALVGLPELPVAGTPDGGGAPTAAAGAALADVTPAAPDRLTGAWWKFDVVRAIVRAQPGRRLVWLDDDLRAAEVVRDWAAAHAEALLVGPDPREGLAAADLDAVDRFLGQSTSDGTPPVRRSSSS